MSPTTPNPIRTPRAEALTPCAEHEPAFRFDAWYDKVSRADMLRHADDRVRSNRGAPGIDGVTCAAIEAGVGKDAYLAQRQVELEQKTYRADGVGVRGAVERKTGLRLLLCTWFEVLDWSAWTASWEMANLDRFLSC
jgi:hypothetical protein